LDNFAFYFSYTSSTQTFLLYVNTAATYLCGFNQVLRLCLFLQLLRLKSGFGLKEPTTKRALNKTRKPYLNSGKKQSS